MVRRLILCAALALPPLSAIAQAAEQIAREATQAYEGKQFARAAQLYVKAAAANPGDANALYNAACSFALAGDKEGALRYLDQAFAAGYGAVTDTEADADLASLHADPRWRELIARAQARRAYEAMLFDSPALATPFQDNLSEDEKIAGLSKFWSEVKFNFVYVETLKRLDWDKLYLEFLPKVRASTSTAQYYRLLMELCAKLQDGHTGIMPPPGAAAAIFSKPLLRTALVEGRVLVRGVYDADLAARGVAVGTEIEQVDGVPARDYAAREIAPLLGASTAQDLENQVYAYQFLLGPSARSAQVVFRDAAGRRFEAEVKRADWPTRRAAMPAAPQFELRMLDGGVAYVALNSFDSPAAADGFIAAFDKIAGSTALIIDLRANGGGSSDVGYRVLATLAARPFKGSAWSTRDYLPSYRAWQRAMPMHGEAASEVPLDLQHRYSKPVVLLTSSATYSAAEDMTVAFDAMQRGTIIGEPTGGSTGQPLIITLPGGGGARICTKRDTYPDGRPFVGVGIAPAMVVHPSVADVRAGRDTVLLAAQEALKSGRAH